MDNLIEINENLKKLLNKNNLDDSLKRFLRETFFINELAYLNVDFDFLPYGVLYPNNFKIKIRPATVEEVFFYSIVDLSSPKDVEDKIEQILYNCIKVVLPDGTEGSYHDIFYDDRLIIIFLIREYTFQKGTGLSYSKDCALCGQNNTINFRATEPNKGIRTLYKNPMDENLQKCFNSERKCFENSYDIIPPTIKVLNFLENNKITKFQKILPYMFYNKEVNKNSVNLIIESLSSDMDKYQDINSIITDIKKIDTYRLEKKCTNCENIIKIKCPIPSTKDLFSLFQTNHTNMTKNLFEFSSQNIMSPDVAINMFHWIFEDWVKLLNEKNENDNKSHTESEKQSTTASMNNIKVPTFNMPDFSKFGRY